MRHASAADGKEAHLFPLDSLDAPSALSVSVARYFPL